MPNSASTDTAKELAERLQKLAIGTPYGLCPELIDAAIKAAEMLAWSSGPSHESPKRYDIQAFTEGYEGSEYAVLEVTEANDGDWVKWSDVQSLFATHREEST